MLSFEKVLFFACEIAVFKPPSQPTRIVVCSFGVIILVGALLLMLPIASRIGERVGALTATCATGLVMVDT